MRGSGFTVISACFLFFFFFLAIVCQPFGFAHSRLHFVRRLLVTALSRKRVARDAGTSKGAPTDPS